MDELPILEEPERKFPLRTVLFILGIVPVLLILVLIAFINYTMPPLSKIQTQPKQEAPVLPSTQLPPTAIVYAQEGAIYAKDVTKPKSPAIPVLFRGKQIPDVPDFFLAGVSFSRRYIVMFEPPERYHIYDLKLSKEQVVGNLSKYARLSPANDALFSVSKDEKIVVVDFTTFLPTIMKHYAADLSQTTTDGKILLVSFPFTGMKRYVALDAIKPGRVLWQKDLPEIEATSSALFLISERLFVKATPQGVYQEILDATSSPELLSGINLTHVENITASKDGRYLLLFSFDTNTPASSESEKAVLFYYDLQGQKIRAQHSLSFEDVAQKFIKPRVKMRFISPTEALLAIASRKHPEIPSTAINIWHVDLTTGRLALLGQNVTFFSYQPTY